MKAWQSALFICAVLGGLALLCSVFPRDGLRVGPFVVELPAMADVIRPQRDTLEADAAERWTVVATDAAGQVEEHELTVEEFVSQQLQALQAVRPECDAVEAAGDGPASGASSDSPQATTADDTLAEGESVPVDVSQGTPPAERSQTERTRQTVAQPATNPIYIAMADSTYLDSFFKALDHADQQAVRVMHYGDSQLEEDRMTSNLRQRLQGAHGGMGIGLRGGGLYPHTYTSNRYTSPDSLPRVLSFWSGMKASHRRYGPICQMNRIDGRATLTFSGAGAANFPNAQTYQRVGILMRGGVASVTADGKTYPLGTSATSPIGAQSQTSGAIADAAETSITDTRDGAARPVVDQAVRFQTLNLPAPAKRVTFTLQGPAELYGVTLDDTIGVIVDNIAMRGSDGGSLVSIDRSTMRPFFNHEPVRLIILQFGGNAMGYLKTAEQQSRYMRSVRAQIRAFRDLAPQACILWVGPSDMSTNVGGQMKTYPWLPAVVDSLRATVVGEGAAFWDMYTAMGGYGSMVRWVKQGLAGGDYVHFTPRGAKHMSDILYETLELYYRYYHYRTEGPRKKLGIEQQSLSLQPMSSAGDRLHQDSRPSHTQPNDLSK